MIHDTAIEITTPIFHRENKLQWKYQLLITLQFTFKKGDVRNMPALYDLSLEVRKML